MFRFVYVDTLSNLLKTPLAFLSESVLCEESLSQTLFSSSSASFLLFHPLLFITPPTLCVCVCPLCLGLCAPLYVCICIFCVFFLLGSVSPCWQRGITAPGIKSSSQAFGWRSTSQMKRMLVHLKVAAELPVDVFAVTLSVIYNLGWFGFLFQGFLQ